MFSFIDITGISLSGTIHWFYSQSCAVISTVNFITSLWPTKETTNPFSNPYLFPPPTPRSILGQPLINFILVDCLYWRFYINGIIKHWLLYLATFHLAWCFQGSCMLLNISVLIFLCMHNILLHKCVTFYLSVYQLMDICVISTLGLWILLP